MSSPILKYFDFAHLPAHLQEISEPVHNLAHALACLAILLDCIELRNLIDNRPPPGKSSQMQDRIKSLRQQERKAP